MGDDHDVNDLAEPEKILWTPSDRVGECQCHSRQSPCRVCCLDFKLFVYYRGSLQF